MSGSREVERDGNGPFYLTKKTNFLNIYIHSIIQIDHPPTHKRATKSLIGEDRTEVKEKGGKKKRKE